ncbi:hypothetical protein [Modestobacter excelsi]|uniref:hypothetical protein n=1 Tax=Modestobacter excelsi TaxID=2213161 RepID=UPI001C20D60F|nr:hypothetical protein [Modestobacter excelsi]
MNRFLQVKQILDDAVGGAGSPVGGPHRAFWRNQTRDQFMAFKIFGLPIVTLGDGAGSNLVKALRGENPFGQDIGTPGATFRRMPAGRPPVAGELIDVITTWIDDGCPEEVGEIGGIEASVEGAPSGRAFLIVPAAGTPVPGRLTLRTVDGSQGDVVVRVQSGSGAGVHVDPATVHASAVATEVTVTATSPSAAVNDTTIEVVQGTTVLASIALTAVARPAVRFRGTFQCRLPTDPDPFDHPWGENSSFGVFAVQGPDPDHPDEPPLDRVVRFHDGVALRPFCDPIGVDVTSIEARVGDETVQFDVGDPVIGLPVRLGSACVFDGRNRTFAPDGFEPIAEFRLELGTVYAGASAPAVPRPSPADPPGSTAPYANGVVLTDADPSADGPGDFGIPAATWAENAWNTIAVKLSRLVAQQPADERSTRIRDRRIQEHTDTRPGHGLDAIATPLQFMERYTGLIDREVVVASPRHGALAFLADLPAVRFTADFLAFDTDCQIGRVTGTLDAPELSSGPAVPPSVTTEAAPGRAAAPQRGPQPAAQEGLRRVPLDQQ